MFYSILNISQSFWAAVSGLTADLVDILSYEFVLGTSTFSVLEALFGGAVIAVVTYTIVKWLLPI